MEAVPKKKKALPFKRSAPKPVVAPRETSSDRDDDDDLDMFRRSKNFFPIAMEEQEERFNKKTSPREDRKTSLDFTYEATGRSPGEEWSKRRKLSPAAAPEEWEQLYDNSEDEVPRHSAVKEAQSPSAGRVKAGSPVRENKSITPRPSRLANKEEKSSPVVSGALPTPIKSDSKSSTTPDGIISLDDDSDDVLPRSAQKARDPRPKPTAAISLDDDDDDLVVVDKDDEEDEDEFAIFIQRARAREAAMKAATEKRARSPDPLASNDLDDSSANDGDPHDPIVEIFVTSCLSWDFDIKPLLIRRRLSANMRPVRESWIRNTCRKYALDLSPAEEAKIILTWKRVKVYNMTTGLSLNLQPDEKGRVASSHAGHDEGFDKGRLHLEVWNEDELNDYLAEEERNRRIELGEEVDDGVAQTQDDDLETQEVQQQEKIRIKLKGREMDEIKMTTYADTPVRTLIAAVRARTRLGSDKHITIMFDGNLLEEDTTMADADIEDMDSLEVYVK